MLLRSVTATSDPTLCHITNLHIHELFVCFFLIVYIYYACYTDILCPLHCTQVPLHCSQVPLHLYSSTTQVQVPSTMSPGADPGICIGGVAPFLPFLFLFPFPFSPLPLFPFHSPLLPFPLEMGPLKPARGLWEHCKLTQRGPRQRPGQKRIRRTLKLWESHWWQSFWVFWSACFTVEQSKFSTRHNTVPFLLIRSTVTASVRRPRGAEAASAPI